MYVLEVFPPILTSSFNFIVFFKIPFFLFLFLALKKILVSVFFFFYFINTDFKKFLPKL